MHKKKILVVDDEINLRETIKDLLIENDFQVEVAANGQGALEILEHWTPDIIICDIMMPVMDGYLFHEIVKENKMLNHIPFVFLTAKTEEREKCLLNGADLFLRKPFKISELIKNINVKIERFEKIKNAYNTFDVNTNNYFSHETNTPLYGILGSVNLLINNEDTIEKKEVAELYDFIKISGERLKRTLKNTLLYENFKNNNLDFSNISHAEIYETFFLIKDEIARQDIKQGRRISFNIQKANIKIKLDYLNFILFELIDNSLKYSENNKKVLITGNKFNEEYYELSITDYGIGLSPEELQKIDIYKQFNRDEREQQGLGIGLFMSRSLMQKSKGIFTIISKIKEGTTINLFFPLYSEKL